MPYYFDHQAISDDDNWQKINFLNFFGRNQGFQVFLNVLKESEDSEEPIDLNLLRELIENFCPIIRMLSNDIKKQISKTLRDLIIKRLRKIPNEENKHF